MSSFSCMTEDTIYLQASPYLYPFVIDFSLLAAATVYRMYGHVGTVVIHSSIATAAEEDPENNGARVEVDCHKSHSGLFWGIVIFTGVFTASCFYIYMDMSPPSGGHVIVDMRLTDKVYLITDVAVSSVALIVFFPTVSKLRRLHFSESPESEVDRNLLIVAVSGYYILLGAMAVPAFRNTSEANGRGELCRLVVAMCLINFVQITLQVILIFDGLRRRAVTADDEQHKPGRSLLAFLIVTNMAMWVINTFLLKEVHHMEFLNEFYGVDTWATMTHIGLPLSIFYRFHAAVCFSEIWQNAYTRDKTCTVNIISFMREDTNL